MTNFLRVTDRRSLVDIFLVVTYAMPYRQTLFDFGLMSCEYFKYLPGFSCGGSVAPNAEYPLYEN